MAEEPIVIPELVGSGYFTVYNIHTGEIVTSGEMSNITNPAQLNTQIIDPANQAVLNKAINFAEINDNWFLPPQVSPYILFAVDLGTLNFIARDPDQTPEILDAYKSAFLADYKQALEDGRRKLISSAFGSKWCYWLLDDGNYPPFYNYGYDLERIRDGLAYAALDPNAQVEFLAKPWDNPNSAGGEFQVFNQAQCAIFARDLWCWYYTIDTYYSHFENDVKTAATMQDLFDLSIAWNLPTEPVYPPVFVDDED